MQVTEIKVFPIDEEKLKAFVSIVIDNCFMVNDIKVIKGRDGLFISMPSRRKKNGKFKDVAHPLNNETRQMIEGLILTDYERALRGVDGADEDAEEEPVVAHSAPPPPEPAELAAASDSTPPRSSGDEPANNEGKSLEEVTELHLRDSFWSS